jgi:hypothetical protein
MGIIIKKMLREALGVPDNIIETSIDLYDDIINELKRIILPYNVNGKNNSFILKFNKPYHIGKNKDFKFRRLGIKINLKRISEADEIYFTYLSYEKKSTAISKNYEKIYGENINLFININFNVPILSTNFDLINFLEKDKTKQTLISSLSHELKHSYDNYKLPYMKTSQFLDLIAKSDHL